MDPKATGVVGRAPRGTRTVHRLARHNGNIKGSVGSVRIQNVRTESRSRFSKLLYNSLRNPSTSSLQVPRWLPIAQWLVRGRAVPIEIHCCWTELGDCKNVTGKPTFFLVRKSTSRCNLWLSTLLFGCHARTKLLEHGGSSPQTGNRASAAINDCVDCSRIAPSSNGSLWTRKKLQLTWRTESVTT